MMKHRVLIHGQRQWMSVLANSSCQWTSHTSCHGFAGSVMTASDAPCMAIAVACSCGSRLPRHPRARKHTHAVVAEPRGMDSDAVANIWRVLIPGDWPLTYMLINRIVRCSG